MRKPENIGLDSNRRTFFRIDESLQITYSLVPSGELDDRIEGLYRYNFNKYSIASEVMSMRHEVIPLMRQITSHSPDIANYLVSIEHRLELLARALSAKDNVLSEQPARSCNLSASGVALPVTKCVEVGRYLEMNLLLLPSYAGLVAIAEVVDCDPNVGDSDEPYMLRVNFTHMRERDRDLLIKHVIQRQGEMLRQRREMGD
jgi:hypothetical protein